MGTASDSMTRGQWIGLAVLVAAVIVTATLVGYEASGKSLPQWFLALTAIF